MRKGYGYRFSRRRWFRGEDNAYTIVIRVISKLWRIDAGCKLPLPMRERIQALRAELKLLETFFRCLKTSQAERLPPMVNLTKELSMVEQELQIPGLLANIVGSYYKTLEHQLLKLVELVHHSMPVIRQCCVLLLSRSFLVIHRLQQPHYQQLEFLNSVGNVLRHVLDSRANILIARAKLQIQTLVEKLTFFRDFLAFERARPGSQCSTRFHDRIQGWCNRVACLAYLVWTDDAGEGIGEDDNVVETYFKVRSDESIFSKPDRMEVGETTAEFVDFVFGNVASYNDLREGFIFLVTFLLDPPREHGKNGELIKTTMDVIVSEATSLMCSIYVEELKDCNIIRNNTSILHASFLEKIVGLKSEARQLYLQLPNIFQCNSVPMTNGMHFIDSLLGVLKKMKEVGGDYKVIVPFGRNQVAAIHDTLESLRPILEDLARLRNESEKLKDLWRRMVSNAYYTEGIINSFLLGDCPMWSYLINLSDVRTEMDQMKFEIMSVIDEGLYNDHVPYPDHIVSANPVIHELVVGFKDEAETIINRLIRGTMQRDIVSIVGIPGQGKTTLAKKVYTDPSVQFHFHKSAWCYISSVYNLRQLLLEILRGVGLSSCGRMTQMSDQELIEKLWRSLMGYKYLIVLDDIWDIGVWHQLRRSFPDDNNGSRILFTSRIHDISLLAKPDCNAHILRSLTEDESRELLKQMLRQKTDQLPLAMAEVEKEIILKCKGLPLAIVVIGKLLAREAHDKLAWWMQIAKSPGSHFAAEGCMDILELSYKHLPEYLKQCFLYFGAFPEGKVIRVRKMVHLWIAEGFVQRREGKSLEVVAEEYLMDLIGRSLVIITKRSSTGGIKRCRIHDLFHHLCLQKAKEEKFLQLVHGYERYDVSGSSLNPIKYDMYRLGIYTDWGPFIKSRPNAPYASSLLFFAKKSWDPYSHSDASGFLHHFKQLKILDLGTILMNTCFPEAITSLVLLRYLEIGGRFREVPSSIAKLRSLETLVVSLVVLLMLPSSVWTMESLRHLDVKTVSRHFFRWQVEMVKTFQVINIETLKLVEVYVGDEEKVFQRFPRLRKLSCVFIQRLVEGKPAELPKFHCLEKLESLKVAHCESIHCVTRSRLQEFSLPKTLKKLTLSRFGLPWDMISAIGKLPNLEALKLRENAFAGPKWQMEDDQFLKLKFLELFSLDIEEWDVNCETFPCLEHLVLRRCCKLESIPSSFGDILTLKMIQVQWCSRGVVSSAWWILDEQHDMGNESFRVLVVKHPYTWEMNFGKSSSSIW